ncbi:MAG TPA: peptidoglycan DD-metalloendopeptidase family protein [Dongiaceae bacterium]|nr:peptidoglycan DD-metalloendopeptidase family protein [Dongiaceae bacterium]
MIFARSQVWGTLKRYLTYTTAGFVVLGGFGAAWSHRPAAIESAAARDFASVQAADQLMLAQNTPGWAQRMMAGLAAQDQTVDAVEHPILTADANDRVMEVSRDMAPRLKPTARWTFGREDMDAPASTVVSSDAIADLIATSAPVKVNPFESFLIASVTDHSVPDEPWFTSDETIAEAIANDIEKVIEVRPGDTLYGVLVNAGITEDDANNAVGAIAEIFSPRDLRAGQEITLNITTASGTRESAADAQLMGLSFEPNVTTDVTLTRNDTGLFVAAAVDKPVVEQIRRGAGIIDSSLFDAAQEAGVPMPVVADLIRTFSFDVDFQRDIQDGDAFEVLYERTESEAGEFVKSGKILFASLTLSGKTIPVYYFERDGDGEYFTPSGEAIRKSLLRTPVDGARVTSGFGMRMHPVLGFSKLHKGIDFGAPTGTPIFAAGTGTIVEIGRKGSYGNYIRIRHNGEYQTAYAHMSKFAKGMKKGDKVKQGQVIGYVGATGRVTGAHLHYEILVAGKQVNPGKVKTVASNKLTGKQLKAFQAQVAKIDAQRTEQAKQQLIAGRPDAVPLDCTTPSGCEN